MQAELVNFYASGDVDNNDVADVLKVRAKAERETGLSDQDIGVSTTQSIKTSDNQLLTFDYLVLHQHYEMSILFVFYHQYNSHTILAVCVV